MFSGALVCGVPELLRAVDSCLASVVDCAGAAVNSATLNTHNTNITIAR